MRRKSDWIPEIMYEEGEEGLSSHIPFILVPQKEEMPKMIFIFESRDTGELEPNEEGLPVPIFEMDLHQYADMLQLKQGLDEETYDKVRLCLGLEPIRQAVTKGREISNNVRKNLEK
jgi:hypothetical protein